MPPRSSAQPRKKIAQLLDLVGGELGELVGLDGDRYAEIFGY